jgi:hypothetical protein
MRYARKSVQADEMSIAKLFDYTLIHILMLAFE